MSIVDTSIKVGAYLVYPDGRITGRGGRTLSPETIKGGYQRVTMNGRHKLVHVVVAEAFIGPKPSGHEVNHIDGNKTNNAASNLEYLTRSANVRHSIDVLRTSRAPGVQNANAKLTDDIVREMRALFDSGVSAAEVGRRFDINVGHAWRIVTRRSWRHIK